MVVCGWFPVRYVTMWLDMLRWGEVRNIMLTKVANKYNAQCGEVRYGMFR
jgi:hypothetical protein